MARANPGRVAAARVLAGVDSGQHAEDLLAKLAPTDGADRRLAWHIVFGVLRRRGSVDALLAPHLRKPLDRLDTEVRAVLRSGAFELAFSRTPAHAAVSQAVEVAKRVKVGRAQGLINAVLRRVRPDDVSNDPLIDLPQWLQERWGDSPVWLERSRLEAPVCGVWRDEPDPDLLIQPLGPGPRPSGAFELERQGGPIDERAGFSRGAWWVMDPAAAHVADLAVSSGTASTPTVLDACAAPGGKSLRMASRGGQITSIDQSTERLARLREASARTGLDLRILQHDWLTGPCASIDQFDVVLVDAPCTGLGTIRRHPEIKWRRLPSDPAAMAIRQAMILEACSQHVNGDGVLVYAVCSPMEEEGRGVVASLDGWSVQTEYVSFPPEGDEDAFQAFVLRRA